MNAPLAGRSELRQLLLCSAYAELLECHLLTSNGEEAFAVSPCEEDLVNEYLKRATHSLLRQ